MHTTSAWLMLISSLPGNNQTARMRVWRGLKASGAAALRDGAYVLPNNKEARGVFDELAADVVATDGTAHIVAFDSADDTQDRDLRERFDRGADYADLFGTLQKLRAAAATLEEAEARRQLAAARRELAALVAIDFFPGPSRRQVESALTDAEAALNARFSPDEPHVAHGAVPKRNRETYRGRLWATRERLWVDRVASAWLIRRFIDPKAAFRWLKAPKDCPKKAVGFDFDGAEFTHVDGRVTFQVLMASFGLESDAGLARLGALVHYLDVGGIAVPEAPGFAAIMAGARMRTSNDDALLDAMSAVLDDLYAAYSEEQER
jgi:hypothetical protein